MGSLRTFVVVSLVCHLILFFTLVDMELSGRKSDATDIYEVAIVAGAPAGGAPMPAAQGKKFLYKRSSRQAALGEITKERGLKETSPELSPSEIRPEKPIESGPDTYEAGSNIGGRGHMRKGPGGGSVPGGGSPSEVALWKARVRGMVETLWKPPPEIEIMDMSLKTTYLLRVSRTGDLLQKKLLMSSGNVPFDRSVLTALNRAMRFPPPPLILVAGQESVEVTMSFTPPKGAY